MTLPMNIYLPNMRLKREELALTLRHEGYWYRVGCDEDRLVLESVGRAAEVCDEWDCGVLVYCITQMELP